MSDIAPDRDVVDAFEMLDRQTEVLEMLAQGAPLEQTLTAILRSLEDLMPGARCSVLLYNADTGTLHSGAAPSLPHTFTDRIEGMSIGPMAGSCGTAVYEQGPVVVTDIATDPRWSEFGALAVAHGLRACWSTPIRGRRGITGTFAVYRLEPAAPSDRDRLLVERYTHVTSIAIDQAALMEAEVARRAAEVASQNKSEFVAALSHDIRTPLQAIAGLTEMLRSVDMPAERRQTALDLMTKAARHITELVDDVLDLARIEAGSLPLRLSDIDLDPLLEEVRDVVAALAADREIDVAVEASGLHVRADPRRLRQILINLATNAVLHNDSGGRAWLTAHGDAQGVVIKVRDSGPGIPPERLERLFVPFDRLGVDDRDVPGAGLGLALAKALTEAMGGSLAVDSAPGEGTAVSVTLPATAVVAGNQP